MGHARAVDIEEDLKKAIESLQNANLLQLIRDMGLMLIERYLRTFRLKNGKSWFMWAACHTCAWSI